MRWLRNALGYADFALQFMVLRRDGPFILGLVTNDTCNLHCIDCRVANVDRYSMSFDEIRDILERFHARGARFLYLEGGEPCLWRDGERRLADVVRLAHDIGYLRVHVYTNGTVHMDTGADFTWVSIDGTGETFRKIRGIPLERVLRHVRPFPDRHAIVFVINTINYREIRSFLEFCREQLPGTGVMFYFHTPYYGIDALYLSREQRREAVATLLDCRRDGLPVLNSRGALSSYLAGNPGLPANYWWVVDHRGEHRCCRVEGDPEICRDCGYTICGEILRARNFSPGALLALARTM